MSGETKFTPGPWAYDGVHDSSCGRPCTEDGCHDSHFSGYYEITGPDGFNDGGDEVDCFVVKEADAALIAASPDMYEALEGMLRHSCVADAHPEDKDGEDHAAESAARKALAKARGESQ